MRDTAFITVTEQDNPPQPQAQNWEIVQQLIIQGTRTYEGAVDHVP
jgi:hypothetical protein